MGDIADGILNGDFDQFTGEYLGPGDGFPRSIEPFGDYPKSKKNKQNEVYSWVKQVLQANPSLAKSIDNRRAAMTFVNKFFKAEGLPKQIGSAWKYYGEVMNHKDAFKIFIKNFKE